MSVPECPNHQLMVDLARRALDDVGRRDVAIDERVIETLPDAVDAGMRGSPTVLIDGRDPFADTTTEPSISCRLYRTPAGYAGIPPRDALVAALRTR